MRNHGAALRARYENLESDEDKSCFLAGCLAVLGCTGYLLVDTGATKNVGGLQRAEDLQWKAIEHGLGASSFDIRERSRFAFGNGTGGESLGLAEVPVRVDGAPEKLQIHILDTDSLLLLGMPDLRRWRAVLDCGDQPAMYCMNGTGRRIPLAELPTGHLALKVVPEL